MAAPKWLSVFGKVVNEALVILGVAQPLVQGFIPASAQPIVGTVISDLQQVGVLTQNIEAASVTFSSPLTGEQKLAAILGPAQQIILSSALVAGHPIAQPDLFKQGCSKIASGVADVKNSLDPASLVSATKTA